MRVISLASSKGGVGKSTLTASLAVAAAEAGERVIALDATPQGSLSAWGDERQAETPAVDQLGPAQLPRLPGILAALAAKGFTVVFLDTPGLSHASANLAVQAADLVLVPARPSRLDIIATWPTVEAIKRIGLQLAFTLNQTPTSRNTRAAEAAAGLGMLGLLAEPHIVMRADHQDAIACGRGVTEFNPTGKAAEEMRALWRWIDAKTKGMTATIIASPSTQPEVVPSAEAAPVPAPAKKASDVVHSSIYLPRTAYRKLQEIALVEDNKVHDLILDGIDLILTKNGHPATERRKRAPKTS